MTFDKKLPPAPPQARLLSALGLVLLSSVELPAAGESCQEVRISEMPGPPMPSTFVKILQPFIYHKIQEFGKFRGSY